MSLLRFLDPLFPPSCASCSRGDWPFCQGCASTLVSGRADGSVEGIDTVLAPFAYEGAARRAVLQLKFSGARRVVGALAAPMTEALVAASAGPFDAVTWVPLGRARRRERGFDQARLLAVAVGRRSGIPVSRLLERTRETDPQARRGAAERRAAMDGAFVARGPAPARVVLIDDVVTTGATAAACAAALHAAGAGRVVLLASTRALARSYTRAGSASGSVVARGASPR